MSQLENVLGRLLDQLGHLPVVNIGVDVATEWESFRTPIVTSDVASGKTLIIPSLCALYYDGIIEDTAKEPIYVLEPNRLLANNAMEFYLELIGEEGRDYIGCINAHRSGEESIIHPNNRIVFTTVGYALNSGLIHRVHNFIFDEIHDTSIEYTLAKAIVERRRRHGEKVRIALMSATVDPQVEIDYWGETAKNFTTEGTAYPVEVIHRPSTDTMEELAVELLTQYNRHGILVFMPGMADITEFRDTLTRHLGKHDLLKDTEIAIIHGTSNGMERKRATAKPTLKNKILIGTNVLETGITFSWVDGGLSTGTGKILEAPNGVHRLVEHQLPEWRLRQQIGRAGRMQPGVFIYRGGEELSQRPKNQIPDIRRLPLTELVMHCASIDINLRDLRFNARETPKIQAVSDAIDCLVSYGFISVDSKNEIHLTEDGVYTKDMPIGYRARAALCEAKNMDRIAAPAAPLVSYNRPIAAILPLVAMIEVGGIRHDLRYPTTIGTFNPNQTSDLLNETFSALWFHKRNYEGKVLHDECVLANISSRKLKEFFIVLKMLENYFNITPDLDLFLDLSQDREFQKLLKVVLFRAFITDVYIMGYDNVRLDRVVNEQLFHAAAFSNGSAVSSMYCPTGSIVSGSLRHIVPRRNPHRPFVVLENITAYSANDISLISERFGDEVIPGRYENYKMNKGRIPQPSKQGTLGDFMSLAFEKRSA